MGFHIQLYGPPTDPLRPINPNNACHLCITAAAGTELAVASFNGTVTPAMISSRVFRPVRQGFTIRRPSSPTRRCVIRLAPIVNNSPLLPPVGVWTVSQFQCGRPPSQAGYRSSPWWPLPRQLANRTRAPLQVPGLAVPSFGLQVFKPRTSCGISVPFGTLSPARR